MLSCCRTSKSVLLLPACCSVAVQVSARDQDSKWLTALALLDDDTFIAADNSHNLVRGCAGLNNTAS